MSSRQTHQFPHGGSPAAPQHQAYYQSFVDQVLQGNKDQRSTTKDQSPLEIILETAEYASESLGNAEYLEELLRLPLEWIAHHHRLEIGKAVSQINRGTVL